MKIAVLEEVFRIDPILVSIWRKEYGEDLLPVQARAVTEGRLFHGGNLIVFAPTTSGKTLIGEMLAATSARKGTRVLYLVPTKALAEEKAAHFNRLYRSAGIATVLSSRDHREWDGAILSASFNIAVLVYEKLSALLVGWPHLLNEVGVVILDELQMLSDEERGGMIEILLTKIKTSGSKIRLLGLSAVLTEGEGLARWLSADLLIEEKRPVPLRKGIFCRGTFFYQEHNSREEGEERWIELSGQSENDLFVPLAAYLGGERGESTLLFFRDKPSVEKMAASLAERLSLSPAENAVEELLTLEETASREFLVRLLKKGVAIHHADLPWEQRDLVERYFRSGSIRILYSTSTLAMGINCPAKNVIIESKQWHYYRQYGRMGIRDLPRALYENMAGRGGRFGYVEDFGRAILVTASPFQVKVWMDKYVKSPLEKVASALVPDDLPEVLLNIIASNEGTTMEEILTFLSATFGGAPRRIQRFHGEPDRLDPGKQEEAAREILRRALEKGVVTQDEKGRYKATELGKITALKGVHLYTALSLVSWMKTTDPMRLSDLEILYALSLTEDAKGIYIPLTREERRRKSFRELIKREIFAQQEEGKAIFKPLSEPMKMLAYEEDTAIKKTLILSEWVTAKATSEIEQAHQIHSGAIRRIGEEFSWLAEAASAIASATGWPKGGVKNLSELSERLIYGVTEKGLALSRIRLRGLGRTYIARMIREGYDSPEAISELSVEVLQKHLPERLARQLYFHFHPEQKEIPYEQQHHQQESVHATEPQSAYPKPSADLPILAIDPGQQALSYRGIHADLSLYPFRLLAALARTPGKVVTKRDLYEAVYGSADGETEDDRPYERQLSDHKRKILTQIRKAVKRQKAKGVTAGEIKSLIVVRRGVGYMLNLEEEKVFVSSFSPG